MGKVLFTSSSGVVGMCVGNDCQWYRSPGVNVKITSETIDTFSGKAKHACSNGSREGWFNVPTKTKKAARSSLPTILPKNLLRNNEVFSGVF